MMVSTCYYRCGFRRRRRRGVGDVVGGGSIRCDWLWWVGVLHLCVLWSWTEAQAGDSSNSGLIESAAFEGVEHIRVVSCSSDIADTDISVVKLFDPRNNTSLVYINLRGGQCRASAIFTSCDLDHRKVTLKAIINDLEEGEVRTYGCEVIRMTDAATSSYSYVNISFTLSTTTTTVTTTTSERSTQDAAKAEESTHIDEGFRMPTSVVIVILALLVFFVTICCVLGIQYYRGRRRKRKSRDCDAMSVRSGVTDKDFYTVALNPSGGGMGTLGSGSVLFREGMEAPGRFMRQFSISSASGNANAAVTGTATSSSSPPGVVAPELPAGNKRLLMQYQKPSDSVPDAGTFTFSDRGYVSGSSVHYQEPWGKTLDDPEILGKLSTLRAPNRHLVRIPDFEATLPRSVPSAPSAPPPSTLPPLRPIDLLPPPPPTPTQETEPGEACTSPSEASA